MDRSPEIADLAKALVKAQGMLEDAGKDAVNPHFKSRYADLASVRAALRVPLSSNGLAYMQLLTATEAGANIQTILMHEGGQYVSETLCVPVTAHTAQALGSAFTYGRRYSLMGMLGIAASEDDDDGNSASRKGNGQTYGNQTHVRVNTMAERPTIDADQIETLRAKLAVTAAGEDGFLKWARISNLGQIEARDYDRVTAQIEKAARK
jgi:hypothetical protein